MVRNKNKSDKLATNHGLFDENHGLFEGRFFEMQEKLENSTKKHNKNNTSAHHRYKFSFETDTDIDKGPKYELMEQTQNLDYGNAFEFSGGNLDENRKNYERTYSSIFSYDGNVDNSKFSNNFDLINENTDAFKRHKGFKSQQTSNDILSRLLFKILCCISAIVLIILIPFFGWYFIKKLNDNERAVVYRLGGRQKIKGPGLVVFLPVVDDFQIVKTDEKTINLTSKPISDFNKAIVEFDNCEVKFKVVDPLHLVKNLRSKPSLFVESCSISALIKAVSKIQHENISENSVSKFELMRDIKYILNIECSSYGIQIIDVNLGKLSLVQSAPKKEGFMDKLKMGETGLGPGGLPGIAESFTKKLTGDDVKLPENTKNALGIFINSLVSLANNKDANPTPNWPTSIPMNGQHVTNGTSLNGSASKGEQVGSKNLLDDVEYDPSGVYVLLSSVLAKSQPLLKSELARQALGKTSLEILLHESDGVTPVKLITKEYNGQACVYLDGLQGTTGFGKLPSGMKPTCSVSLTKEDLTAALSGRLDLIDAVANNRAKLTGDLIALSKLKFLVQLQPSKSVY